MEHAVAHRPSDEREAHVGVPLAARKRAAVQPPRRRRRKRSTSYGDETDLDQTLVGTLTSVLSDTKVNTVRYGLVLEDTVHANPAWRALESGICAMRAVPGRRGRPHREAGPILDYDTLDIQVATARWTTRPSSGATRSTTRSRGSSPKRRGRHDLKFGARYSLTIWLSNPVWGNMNGHLSVPGHRATPSSTPDNPR